MGVGINFNGTSTPGNTIAYGVDAFHTMHPFALTAFLSAGVNTLDFLYCTERAQPSSRLGRLHWTQCEVFLSHRCPRSLHRSGRLGGAWVVGVLRLEGTATNRQ